MPPVTPDDPAVPIPASPPAPREVRRLLQKGEHVEWPLRWQGVRRVRRIRRLAISLGLLCWAFTIWAHLADDVPITLLGAFVFGLVFFGTRRVHWGRIGVVTTTRLILLTPTGRRRDAIALDQIESLEFLPRLPLFAGLLLSWRDGPRGLPAPTEGTVVLRLRSVGTRLELKQMRHAPELVAAIRCAMARRAATSSG